MQGMPYQEMSGRGCEGVFGHISFLGFILWKICIVFVMSRVFTSSSYSHTPLDSEHNSEKPRDPGHAAKYLQGGLRIVAGMAVSATD